MYVCTYAVVSVTYVNRYVTVPPHSQALCVHLSQGVNGQEETWSREGRHKTSSLCAYGKRVEPLNSGNPASWRLIAPMVSFMIYLGFFHYYISIRFHNAINNAYLISLLLRNARLSDAWTILKVAG